MKNHQIIKISAAVLILLSGCGLILSTSVYDDVYDSIVQVLCLSCLKLEPKTEASYTFETANGLEHLNFVLNNLSDGVVFLHFSEDACQGCDIMYPIIKELFSIEFEKDEMTYFQIPYENSTVNYYYSNIDHATEERIDAFFIYDKDHIGGLPMFTIITLGYDSGIIKPYYTSIYGTLNLETDEERLDFLHNIMRESIEIWNENHAAYHP